MRGVVHEWARKAKWVIVRRKDRVGIPIIGAKVRRDLRGDTRTLGRALTIGGCDQDDVQIRCVLR